MLITAAQSTAAALRRVEALQTLLMQTVQMILHRQEWHCLRPSCEWMVPLPACGAWERDNSFWGRRAERDAAAKMSQREPRKRMRTFCFGPGPQDTRPKENSRCTKQDLNRNAYGLLQKSDGNGTRSRIIDPTKHDRDIDSSVTSKIKMHCGPVD